MADLKISQLNSIVTVVPATDVLPVVQGGTTLKITPNQILGAGGTATLASATITGALTANGGIAMANATSLAFGGLLTIYSDTAAGLFIRGRTVTGTTFQTQDGTQPLLNISNSGIFTFSDGAGGTRMTLNSTGLAIGDTAFSGTRLTIRESATNPNALAMTNRNATQTWRIGVDVAAVDDKILGFYDSTSATFRMQLTDTGNLGIGVTPLYKFHAVVTSGAVGAFRATTAAIARLLVGNTVEDVELKVNANGDGQLTANASKYLGLGSGGINDRVILDVSGNLLVGTTTANGRVAVDTDLAVYNGMSVKNTGTTYGASSLFFRFLNSSGVTAGSIQHTAVTTTNYSTTSDARLKESKGISNDTSVIDNTVVHDFIWKADGSTDRGVFAQEAHAVKPRAVSVGSDELTEDGNIKTPWSVDYSKFVPDLIVYCQQLKKQVVELTARVQTLEAK
jgi:hypothetical protein